MAVATALINMHQANPVIKVQWFLNVPPRLPLKPGIVPADRIFVFFFGCLDAEDGDSEPLRNVGDFNNRHGVISEI
jgi:hypothetical protein